MRYHIIHRTTYRYESPVTVCHYMARLAPRALPGQECPWHELSIRPDPVERASRADYFGNHCIYFEIEGAHHQLEVTARSLVDVRAVTPVDPLLTPAWESIRDACGGVSFSLATAASEFCFASPLITPGALFSAYALGSFTPGRPVLDALCDLNRRIFTDFTFDPAATDIATPITEVMTRRRGVCQDFAHVMIAGMRGLGLPAAYVSGFLRTLPPPGQPRLEGADATHAWVAVWCGAEIGWVGLDPTNDMRAGADHVIIAIGRDYADVAPESGIVLTYGPQRLDVAVDVAPSAEG